MHPGSAQVQGSAQATFGAVLERQAEVEKIKGVLTMLQRYDSLFRLPTRIRSTRCRGPPPPFPAAQGVLALSPECGCSKALAFDTAPPPLLKGAKSASHPDKGIRLSERASTGALGGAALGHGMLGVGNIYWQFCSTACGKSVACIAQGGDGAGRF